MELILAIVMETGILLLFGGAALSGEDGGRLGLRLKRRMVYAGLTRKFPILERGSLLLRMAVFLTMGILIALYLGLMIAVLVMMGLIAVLFTITEVLRYRERKKTAEGLMRFLEFMGNYSTTTGEITWILEQIEPFMEEPIRSGILICTNHARLTGNTEEALTQMCERIEHEKFREIIRNLRIGMRYVKDLKLLVDTCKQSVREYERACKEKNTMVMEAVINMSLLIGMLFLGILLMDKVLPFSVVDLLLFSFAGRAALGFVGLMIGLFALQVLGMEK